MKSIRLLALSLVTVLTVSAQNTYPFPASGNVGIGTTSPTLPLTVYGGNELADFQSNAASSLIYFTPTGSWHRWRLGAGDVNVNDFGIRDISEGATRLSISGTGNVGIGISSPGAKLDVAGGEVRIPGGSASGSWNTNPSIFTHFNYAGDGKNYIRGTTIIADSGGYVGIGTSSPLNKFDVKLGADQHLLVRSGTEWGGGATGVAIDARNDAESGSIPLRIRASTIALDGNVGIGTTSALSPLTIFNSYGGTGVYALTLATAFSQGNTYAINPFIHGVSNGGFSICDVTNSTPRLVIQQDSGNVGIGTTNPAHKLAVNGTIKAKEVIVETTGWSDYVFADNYALQPLSEVETHIKTNKHLPGIPSAAQVAEQGVSLGDMQARLLAKIEELTLHQIAQEKELASLRQEVRTLRESSAK